MLTSRINQTYSFQSVVQVELVLESAKPNRSCKNMGFGKRLKGREGGGGTDAIRKGAAIGLYTLDRPPYNTKDLT